MSCKNEAWFMSSYFNSKRKESINLLFLKLKFIIAYNVNFEDILKTHHVIKTDDEESRNWRKLQLLMRRKHAFASFKNHEIKSIQVTVQRSFNKNNVSFNVFSRIFLMSRVNICNMLKKHWNHQWTHWISSYTNYSFKVASSQSNYVIEYHIKLFLNEVIQRLQELASFNKNKLSFLVFFVKLKEALSMMNVAKLQNLHNKVNAIYNILRLHQMINEKNNFYNRIWVLSLNINDEIWRL